MTNIKILLLLVGVAILAAGAGYATRVSTFKPRASAEVASQLASAHLNKVSANSNEKTIAQSKPLWYWEFTDLAGEQRLLSEWQGPYLVVNFWATWCPPCLKEIPSFVQLQKEFGADKVQFLGIAYDYPDAVQEFLKQTKVNYPVLLGGDDVAIFMRELGNKVGGLPYTAVLDAEGKLVASHQGEWHQADAATTLQNLLEPAAQAASK